MSAQSETNVDGGSPDLPSERAFEILRLLNGGYPDAAIARRLGVSVRTVREEIAHLRELTGTDDRFQLAREATKRGWID